MADLGSLAKKMRQASKVVLTNADKLVKDIAEGILIAVADSTPVDTGAAISNWTVAIGSIDSTVREPYVPGKKGSTHADNIIASVEMGTQKISAFTNGQVIHITNNLRYIEDLNAGSSNQAPPGYVQDAILEALSKIQAAGYKILHNIEV